MKKGTAYEKLSTQVVASLNHNKSVQHDVRIVGKLSDIQRQIDVKLDESAYDFVMYECKDWRKTVGVGVVGQLLTDLEDVGAKRGAIISNSRFTKGAKNMASKKGVDLLHLIKSDDPLAKVGISVTTLVTTKVVDACSIAVEDMSFNAPFLSMDMDVFTIIDNDGERLTIRQYVKKQWNNGLNVRASIGDNIIDIPNARIVDTKGDEYTITMLTITVRVGERYFEGPWLVEEAQGLYNVLQDTFHAYGNMKSALLSVREMQDTFVEILPEKLEPNKYSISLVVSTQFNG